MRVSQTRLVMICCLGLLPGLLPVCCLDCCLFVAWECPSKGARGAIRLAEANRAAQAQRKQQAAAANMPSVSLWDVAVPGLQPSVSQQQAHMYNKSLQLVHRTFTSRPPSRNHVAYRKPHCRLLKPRGLCPAVCYWQFVSNLAYKRLSTLSQNVRNDRLDESDVNLQLEFAVRSPSASDLAKTELQQMRWQVSTTGLQKTRAAACCSHLAALQAKTIGNITGGQNRRWALVNDAK